MTTPQAGFKSFNWMRGVSDDKGISVVHRLILIRLCLHRRNSDGRCTPGYDAVADEIGVWRSTVFRAVDVAIGRGWLAPLPHGGRSLTNFIFTFPDEAGGNSRTGATVNSRSTATVKQPTVAPGQRNSRTRATQQSHGESDLPASSKASTRNGSLNGRREREKSQTLAPTDLFGEGKKESGEEGRKKKNNRAPPGADRFPEFWAANPKHVGKLDAAKAFTKALQEASADELIAGAKRYAAERADQDPRYTKHPATWLNKGCWADEPASDGGPPIIDGITGDVIESPTPPRRNGYHHEKTWDDVYREYAAELEACDEQ
jgi:hypothetical protein